MRKSKQLRANPKRGVGFEQAQEVSSHPYYLDHRSDLPEVREDEEGEYYHLVTCGKQPNRNAAVAVCPTIRILINRLCTTQRGPADKFIELQLNLGLSQRPRALCLGDRGTQ